MQPHYLREQNYQLKNQITDLKNAFDLNRDILKLLSNYTQNLDPHYNLLMQIITRLTSVNNQAMLNNIELINHKNILKQENLKLNQQLNFNQLRLNHQIESNKLNGQPNESKMMMQDQFNSLSRELMAANQERICKDQEIQFWKHKYENGVKMNHSQLNGSKGYEQQYGDLREKIKRRYESNTNFKYQILNRQLTKQNGRLRAHIQELQNRLLVFIKAYNLQQDAINEGERTREAQIPFFDREREEIRLLKYALNDIQIEREDNQCILTITQRFKDVNVKFEAKREKRSISWPKLEKSTQTSAQGNQKTKRMEERLIQQQRGRF